jgi:hypothetical protein
MTIGHREHKVGSICVLSAILISVMLAFVAFAVDIGYILVTRTEMQRSADASALASAWALINERGNPDNPNTRAVAARYVALNKAGHISLELAADDVEVGRLSDPSDFSNQLNFSDPNRFNAVQVRVQRTAAQNGELPLFFARAIGTDSAAVKAQATASFYDNIRGFRIPEDPSNLNLDILPIALDLETWNDLDAADEGTTVNLFPHDDGPPGNRGTVDIGSSNNSTADIARQIVDGVSPDDLDHHGGAIETPIDLNGDTGISAGVKDELESIKGLPRKIPIFSSVSGPGNNATYHIVHWACIEITDVKLTGPLSQKTVTIKKSTCTTAGAIPADPGAEQFSTGIYSYPRLVR